MTPSLKELEEQIGQAKAAAGLDRSGRKESSTSYAFRAGVDLFSGVAVGCGMGYALDAWAETLPLFFILGMILGFIAGMKLVIQTANKASQALEEEERQSSKEESS